MQQDFRAHRPEEMDLILIETTDQGPFVEDCFYLLLKGESFWRIPNSNAGEVFAWLGSSDKIDWMQSVLASCSVENATFVLWRKEGPPVLSAERDSELKTRFARLLERRFEIEASAVQALYESLVKRYSEAHRAYHTMDHISHCLWELDQIEEQLKQHDEIELAIWYHDAVYEIRSKTNEEDSAKLLKKHLGSLKTSIDLQTVEALILASKHLGSGHAPQSSTTDLFLDIDLSILGQTPLDYARYCRQVREEYKSVGRLRYAYGRKKVLKHFLSIPLYRTTRFKTKYEAQAKANLANEIKAYWWMP